MMTDENLPLETELGEKSPFGSAPYTIQANLSFISRSLYLTPRVVNKQKRRPILPGRPVAVRIDNGNYGVVVNARPLTDRDGLEEIYLEGELVLTDEYDLEGKVEITQLRKYPGTIHVLIRQEFFGLSMDETDLAQIKLVMNLRLEEPKQFVAKFPYLQSEHANDRINQQVESMIESKMKEYLLGDAGLWTSTDFYNVMGEFLKKMNEFLSSYGLQVDDQFIAYKTYPVVLRDLVIEYRMVEKYFLDQLDTNKMDLGSLGLVADDFSTVMTISRRYGRGSGFFELSIQDSETTRNIANWLSTLSSQPHEIIQFLNKRPLDVAESEFTRHMMNAAFRSPMLAVGEWADTEIVAA